MKNPPKISIIFPIFNGEHFLSRNLDSIKRLINLNEIELILIDNNSKDSSIEIINSYTNSINIKIIKNRINQGFVRACNLGVLISKGKYVFITNQDVIFPSDFFVELLKIYNRFEKKGNLVISPSLIFENDGIHYYGAKIHILGFSYTPEIGKGLPKQKIIKKTQRFSGGTLFIQRNTFLKMGGFDKRFFMYYEDTDLSLRFLRKGIVMYTTSYPYLIHQKHELTFNDFRYFLLERNRYIVFCKNIDGFKKLIPIFLITEILLIFQSILMRKFRIRIRIYYELLHNLKSFKELRRESKKQIPLIPYQNLSRTLDVALLGNLKKNTMFLKLLKIYNSLLKLI
ncbi:MAG: glycosyltransferase family 2 protein [Promethearchaeota archaeon]